MTSGYHTQALVVKNLTRTEYLNSLLDKQHQEAIEIVKEEVGRMNDKQVEDIVYGLVPIIPSKVNQLKFFIYSTISL